MPAPENIKPTSSIQHHMTKLALIYQNMGFGHLAEIAPTLVALYATKLSIDLLQLNDQLKASEKMHINCASNLIQQDGGSLSFTETSCQQISSVDQDLMQQIKLIQQQMMYGFTYAIGTYLGASGFQLLHHISSLSQQAWASIGGKQLQSKLVEYELNLKQSHNPSANEKFLQLLINFFRDHHFKSTDRESISECLDYLYDNGLEDLLNEINTDLSSLPNNSFEYHAVKLFKEITRPQNKLVPLVPLFEAFTIRVEFNDSDQSAPDFESSSTPSLRIFNH